MCIRVGSGWTGANTHSTFAVEISSGACTMQNLLAVDVYSSGRAIYLNSTTYHCSAKEVITGAAPCDWNSLFAEEPTPAVKNTTINLLVTEYSSTAATYPYFCSSFTYLRFPNYVFDTSAVTNPLSLVLVEDNGPVTANDEPISVHPDWVLAAWSVNKNGSVKGVRLGFQTFTSTLLVLTRTIFTTNLTLSSACILPSWERASHSSTTR